VRTANGVVFVSRILIYPVKSLDPHRVTESKVLPSGALEHDRTFAMFDAAGNFVNGKRHAAVHRIRSQMNFELQTLTLRDEAERGPSSHTFHIYDERTALNVWLSEFFGVAVELREDKERGFPDDLDSPGPTIVGTGTLEEIGTWFGLSVEQIRARLRTNIEIDGVPPFWEDRLFGRAGTIVRFRLGETHLQGINPCQRCVVPPRDPSTGELDPSFVRRFTELRSRTLPAWSHRERFNHFYRVAINSRIDGAQAKCVIRDGDQVEIIDPPVQPEAKVLVDRQPDFWSGELEVESVVDETWNVKTFRLRHPSKDHVPFRFRPGQFLTITSGGGQNRTQRCYTVASSPAQRDFCEITVKRDGAASARLHDHVVPGSRLAVSGPMGRFIFDGRGAEEIVMIAGGVGITPLISKIRFLTGEDWQGRIDLIYSVKTSRDLIFREELARLQGAARNLRIHITVTSEDAEWSGHRGRLSAEWIREVVPDIATRHVHMCGPAPMANALRLLLRQLDVPEARIESESFGGEPIKQTGESVCEVRFARSGVIAAVPGSETLLDAALAAGVALDYGCRAGACGRCKAILVDGEVTIDCDFILTPGERAAQMVLTCQTRPCGPVTIDL
jgi:ferredoxin-NADP reductase/uncharacterized protein YcbX